MLSENLMALAGVLEKLGREGVPLASEDFSGILAVVRQAADDARELELRAVPQASRLSETGVADFTLAKARRENPRRKAGPFMPPNPDDAA